MQKIFRHSSKLIAVLWAAGFALSAQTFFPFNGSDGAYPGAGLYQATDGYLYGTTSIGGANNMGVIYKISPTGSLTLVHSFRGTDGQLPYAGLLEGWFEATRGYLFGTTQGGGAYGEGTVFRLGPSGLTTFHSFNAATDGTAVNTGLVQTTDGWLYGTTYNAGPLGFGTVFKIANNGDFTTVYSFNGDDGHSAQTLIQGLDGNLYGTTAYGGNGGAGGGTVFKMTLDGTLTTLYTFCPQNDCSAGANPAGALVQAANGLLYGTTVFGGDSNSDGVIFQITTDGALTVLHTFDGTDGSAPAAGLMLASDGDLYGTTSAGGTSGNGSIFKVTTGGTFTSLYSFPNSNGNPQAGLTQDTNGHLYGTTDQSGTGGSYFTLSEGLSPFVSPLPGAAKAGDFVWLLGTNLSTATGVTFNGVPATDFVVKSSSWINVSVPQGATTGPIQVVTPTATISSIQPFVVQ